jgi:[acyl-carrier-protein] S-malonyltransferase
MTKTAWVFPGQGSQSLGMGLDLISLATAREKFQQAEDILGWSVLEVCQGEAEKLNQTLYTQPCLYTVSAILVDVLKDKGQQPEVVAGHSLGEYVALYAAGVFDFATGLSLVKFRSQLMDQAEGGKMVALLGGDRAEIEAAIATEAEVVLANDNCPGQLVISGTPVGVDAVVSKIKVKKAMPLKVSGAFHSPLMRSAATEFAQALQAVPFTDAQFPLLSNVDPTPATAAEVLKERLTQQMTGSVRWQEISQQLPILGVDRVVEVGPGKVLTGLIKRTCEGLILENVGSLADITN